MTTQPSVRVRGLTKSYGDRPVLHGLSFDVRAGETVAVLGPNGAGKSTTVEILEGHRRRTGGEVAVLGVDPARADRAWRARVGVVLQSSGGDGSSTVREIVRSTALAYPAPRDADEVIAAVGLTAQAGQRLRSLSGGQRRRVDVALGIVGRPEVLFLDEPTTGFDPEARRAFWGVVRSLSDTGTSIVLTTHYLDEAAQLSDRVVVVAAGRVVAEGTPDTLGGPEARTPHVRWTGPDGRAHDVTTAEPAALVARLVADGGEPAGLEVVRPTLEDVYLGLVAEPEPVDAAGATAAPAPDRAGTAGTAGTAPIVTEEAR
jgi:ABC-2 type transport system ATP-binding protein